MGHSQNLSIQSGKSRYQATIGAGDKAGKNSRGERVKKRRTCGPARENCSLLRRAPPRRTHFYAHLWQFASRYHLSLFHQGSRISELFFPNLLICIQALIYGSSWHSKDLSDLSVSLGSRLNHKVFFKALFCLTCGSSWPTAAINGAVGSRLACRPQRNTNIENNKPNKINKIYVVDLIDYIVSIWFYWFFKGEIVVEWPSCCATCCAHWVIEQIFAIMGKRGLGK